MTLKKGSRIISPKGEVFRVEAVEDQRIVCSGNYEDFVTHVEWMVKKAGWAVLPPERKRRRRSANENTPIQNC